MEFPQIETPKLKNLRQVSDGWLKKYVMEYELPDGTLIEYDTISRKGPEEYMAALQANGNGEAFRTDAVCIVPVLPDGSLVLIREFRYPVNAWAIALPAGLLDPGEEIEVCAARELSEETGYRLRDEEDAIVPFPQPSFSSFGMSDENVQIVIAKAERAEEAHTESTEFIQVFELKREDIGDFLRTNTDIIGTRCQVILEAFKGIDA